MMGMKYNTKFHVYVSLSEVIIIEASVNEFILKEMNGYGLFAIFDRRWDYWLDS